jgi:glyoxylase-like metal-dependent hydrolase (beta-lactamase superfamily II)
MQISEVTPDVYAVHGDSVNWTLVRDTDGLVLVDAGYPGDADEVIASIRDIGHTLDDVTSIVVTHGHIDHMGGIPALREKHSVPVLTAATEVANVRRERREQASPGAVLGNLWRHGALRWVVEIMGKGALADRGVSSAQPFTNSSAVPGGLVPISSHGHTSGHTSYLLPQHGVLISGDALVTGHPLSRVNGPQLLPAFFDHDRGAVQQALDTIATADARAIIPGHGPVYRGSPADAVRELRARN